MRYATPRDPDRETLGHLTLAHLTRLRRGVPYPWQWDVAETAGELNDDGTGFRYPLVLLAVPRRAGKTTLSLADNLALMDRLDNARCWYTAQTRETAAKIFRDEWAPSLEPFGRTYRLRKSQGSEGVHKRRGSSRLQLFAPTATALHSTNVDKATVDEAWAFDIDGGEAVMGGVSPAQLTRPWRQTWIVSAGGTIESTWWDRMLTMGAAGVPGVALFDYGADPKAPGYDPADPAVWAASHPTCGVAFGVDVLEQLWARRTDDAEFERAYLNVWPRPSEALTALDDDLAPWPSCAHPGIEPARVTAVAFDIAADRSSASLAIAGPDAAGDVTVLEVIDNRPGTAWLVDAVKLARRRYRGARLVADSIVAASVVDQLAKVGVTVEPVGAGDHARACGTFVDGLGAGTLSHRAQAVLDAAVDGAARRPLGDAWLWSRSRSTVDISPLVAVTLAAWAAARRGRGRAAVVASTPAEGPRRGVGSPRPSIGRQAPARPVRRAP